MKLQAASIRPEDGKLIILLQFGHDKFVSIKLEKDMDHIQVRDKLVKAITEIRSPVFWQDHLILAEVDIEDILSVLIHAVGDNRQCPKCRHSFVPEDRTQKEAWELYKRIKGE